MTLGSIASSFITNNTISQDGLKVSRTAGYSASVRLGVDKADEQDTAPDIFETSDEPERLLAPSDGVSEDDAAPKKVTEGININGLPDRNRAQQIFGRTAKSRQQFRLPPLRTHTLDSDSETEDERRIESTAARLRRLKAELAEVEAEIKAGPSSSTSGTATKRPEDGRQGTKRRSVLPPRPAVDLAGELSGLRERLSNLEDVDFTDGGRDQEEDEWAGRLQRLKMTGEPGGGEEADVNDRGDAIPQERAETFPASELDKRLARLENALGSDESNTPLLPSLAKTDHLLSLLTQPRHLDAISRRIKLLLVDLDRAATASRRTAQTPNLSSSPEKKPTEITLSQIEYSQLNQLFNLLPRLDPLIPIIDPLLTRLRSLQTLHAESAEVAEGLKKLQSTRSDQQDEAKELKAVVDEVQRGIGEATEGIERNWKSVETRLTALDQRIKDLGR